MGGGGSDGGGGGGATASLVPIDGAEITASTVTPRFDDIWFIGVIANVVRAKSAMNESSVVTSTPTWTLAKIALVMTVTSCEVTPRSIAARPCSNADTSNVETSPATTICMLTTFTMVAPGGNGGERVVDGGEGNGGSGEGGRGGGAGGSDGDGQAMLTMAHMLPDAHGPAGESSGPSTTVCCDWPTS